MSEHAGAWFTDPEFLRKVGRDSIAHFFAAFAPDLQADNVTLPDPKLPDDLYFQEAARFLSARRFRLWLSPNHLPVLRRTPSFNLEPLRRLGPDALEADGVKEIVKITLCGFKVVCRNGHCQTHTSEADDIFAGRNSPGPHHPAIPQTGSLTWASFRIQFVGPAGPRTVVLCPPRTIELLQESDLEPVIGWLSRRGFKLAGGLKQS